MLKVHRLTFIYFIDAMSAFNSKLQDQVKFHLFCGVHFCFVIYSIKNKNVKKVKYEKFRYL